MNRLRAIPLLLTALLVVGSCAQADWDDCRGLGLFPYWQHGGDWYTLLGFINTWEDTSDLIHIRFRDRFGAYCSDITSDMYSIRQREMIWFSTSPADARHWIPTTSSFGYIKFRNYAGAGWVHAFCLVYNRVTGKGCVVPAFREDEGF